jgi:hypothetical protein
VQKRNRQMLGVGSILPGSDRWTSAGVVPARQDRHVAKAWRFWAQGAQFYAGIRDAVPATKVSFHESNWHMDVGHKRLPLAAGLPLALPGWTLALQLKFIVRPDAVTMPLLTPVKKKSNFVTVEVPVGSTLIVNLMLAPSFTRLDSPFPPGADGTRFLAIPLRGGGTMSATLAVLPQNNEDVAAMNEAATFRAEITQRPGAARPVAEVYRPNFSPAGNTLWVVPIPASSFNITVKE